MKQKLSLFFLTLVAPTFILNAAPHEFSEDHKKKKTNSSTSTSLENKDFVISTLPKPSKEELQKENQVEFYPYIQSMSPRISFKINAQDVKDTEAVYGLLYLIPRFKSPQWEAGADLTGSGNGSIHLSKRFIINERDYFRPYYKYGLNLSIMPQEKLATFLNVKNYVLKYL